MFDPLGQGLIGVAALLGLKHGVDADHLAAIDGLSRLHASAGRARIARASGLLFSLGHGVVVWLAAGLLRGRAELLPPWLEPVGNWISICMLTALGVLNLRHALRGQPDGAPRGIAYRLLRFWPVRGPLGSLATGALFAVSLDTLAIAAWFSVAGSALNPWLAALALPAAFVAGMVATDALNGWWVAHLVRRSDGLAPRASRLFASWLAILALGVAGLGLARHLAPAASEWLARNGVWTSAWLIVAVLLGFGLATRSSRAQTLDGARRQIVPDAAG